MRTKPTMIECTKRTFIKGETVERKVKFDTTDEPAYIAMILNRELVDAGEIVHGKSVFLLSGIHDWSRNRNTGIVTIFTAESDPELLILYP